MELNNREIAILIWFLILFIFLIWSAEIRRDILGLMKYLLGWKLQVVVGASLLYSLAWIFMLSKLSVWSWNNLKTTILWFLTFAIYEAFNAHKVKNINTHFKSTFSEVLTIAFIINVISEFSTLNLFAELIIVPVFSILSIVAVFSEHKTNQIQLGQALQKFFIFTGIVWVLWNIGQICLSPSKFFSIATLREVSIPLFLSVLYFPFLYLIRLLFAYDYVFVRINFVFREKKLRRKTKKLIFFTFFNDIDFLERWHRHFNLRNPKNYIDVKHTVKDIIKVKKREKNPPIVPKELGWAPRQAQNFLSEFDLKTSDYHWCYDEDWSAASNYLKLEDEMTANNLAFYLAGNEMAVRELTLSLNVNNPRMKIAAEERFIAGSKVLADKALGKVDQILLDAIYLLTPFTIKLEVASVSLTKDLYTSGIVNGYNLRFTISMNSN